MEQFFQTILNFCLNFGIKLLAALLVLIIGRIAIKLVMKALRNRKPHKYTDPTVHRFLLNFINIGLHVLLVVTIIAILGVPMASVVAVIASAGVAIGLALQGSLSNLAGGIMILIFRPFKLGDYITAGDNGGTVQDIGIFYTTLKTPDNKAVTIPNGTLMNSEVINYSVYETRRIDYTFRVACDSDIELVKKIILEEAEKHELVRKDPAMFCRMTKRSESSLDFSLRVWVNSSNFGAVNSDLLENIHKRFAEEGIEVPYHTVDVNIKK